MRELRPDPATWAALDDDAEALLAQWSVAPGDAVAAGQEIGVFEIVKASVAIAAPAAGRIEALCVPAGTSFGRHAVLALLRCD